MADDERSREQNVNERPTYEKMIAAAIASNNYSKRGVSRQRIANHIRMNYNVPQGSLFKSALLSALKWGIDSGLWCFGETKRRYKFIDHKDKLKTQRRGRRHTQRLSKNRANTSNRKNRDNISHLLSTFKRLSEKEMDIQRRMDQLDSIIAILPTEDDMARTTRSSILNDTSIDNTNSTEQLDRNQLGIASPEQMNAELVAQKHEIVISIENGGQSLMESQRINEIARTASEAMIVSDINWKLTMGDKSEDDDELENEESHSLAHIALRQHIHRAEETSDLLCMLSHSHFIQGLLDFITLEDLQRFLLDKVNKMDNITAHMAHCDALPINEVLPEDVMRHVLSFGHLNQNRTVCRQWNRLNKQNEETTLRAMYNALDNRNLESLGSAVQTWIVHPTRPTLNPLEI